VLPSDSLRESLGRRLREAQSDWRMPSVSATVFRGGGIVWQEALGLAGVEPEEGATAQHQYRVGSITKTFTAVLVLQLRDAGTLELSTPLHDLVPEAPTGPTVADALSHLSGLQREPPGEIWETVVQPDTAGLLAGLTEAEQVLSPAYRWHYSNLAFGVLGAAVDRLGGAAYADALRERILEPLELRRTTLVPAEPYAQGFFVEPYSDGVRAEAHVELPESTAALGQLWSTAGDLARWGSFLASGHDRVLARSTLDEMAFVRTMVDHRRWTVAWGLGLELYRRGDHVLAGHGGAMPGFLAGFAVERSEGVGAAVLTNSSAGPDPESLAVELACMALDANGGDREHWRPDAGAPVELEPLLGRWWSEGRELVFSYRGGRLQARLVDGPEGRDTSWFEPEGEDRWRVREGRELGEVLRVVRDEEGVPTKLYLATYPLTRDAEIVGEA
jgi:CubicO group peptidase (beta-lactamase class C family)